MGKKGNGKTKKNQGNYQQNRQGNPLNRWPTIPGNGFMHPASMAHAIPMNIPSGHRYGWPVMPHVMLSQQPADQVYQPMVSMAAGPMVPGSAPIPIPVLGQYREPWTGNGSVLPAMMPMQIDHNLSKDNGVRLPPSGGPGTFPPLYAGAQECYQGFSSQLLQPGHTFPLSCLPPQPAKRQRPRNAGDMAYLSPAMPAKDDEDAWSVIIEAEPKVPFRADLHAWLGGVQAAEEKKKQKEYEKENGFSSRGKLRADAPEFVPQSQRKHHQPPIRDPSDTEEAKSGSDQDEK